MKEKKLICAPNLAIYAPDLIICALTLILYPQFSNSCSQFNYFASSTLVEGTKYIFNQSGV